ncbi:surfeit locus 1 family protein [Sulfurisoma sediminicola]|uniref:SURF1-like protein n=1 Tax=Sulfurisoma sediminicola TaxID=1381557 RepID=A0A497XJ61_9PROT|nr:surfeit locus 1 family protein [Sulfurisoma sediminicola]
MPAASASRRGILVWGGLLVVALVTGFVSLGLWQWNKYAVKTERQSELDQRSHDALIAMPHRTTNAPQEVPLGDADFLRYRHVELTGEFEPARQILIDNRVDPTTERAGYHVVTPLHLAGSDMRVLVNRGWVPAAADHRVLPEIATPVGPVTLTGIAVVPPARFFTLAQPAAGWQPVWQNLDLARYAAAAPWPLQPVVVELDPTAPHGYARAWPRPDERADKHLSYALQWFGFAASSIGIWLFFLLRRP